MTDPLKSPEDIYEEIDERAQTKTQKRELVISAIQAELKRAEELEKEKELITREAMVRAKTEDALRLGINRLKKERDEKDREIERLKAENERLVKNAEDNQKLCADKHNLMVSERSKWAEQRTTIDRLTASLARAHEALEYMVDGVGDLERIRGSTALRLANQALSDPTGKQAFEMWKKMEAVVEAGMKVEKYLMWINVYDAHLKECFDEKVRDSWRKIGGLTDDVFRSISEFRKSLEALDAKGMNDAN